MALKLSGLLLVGALLVAATLALTVAPAAPRARAATGGWTAEYFNNMTLDGAPVLVREEGPNLDFHSDFDNGGAAPSGVNIEQFSARWTRTDDYVEGTYRITAAADDGMRIYVDGALEIDAWYDQAVTTYTVDVPLSAGAHSARVEFYNNALSAVASVRIESLVAPVEATAVPEAEATAVPEAEATAVPTATDVPVAKATEPEPEATPTADDPLTAVVTLTPGRTPPTAAATPATGNPLGPTRTPGVPPRIECLWALPDMNSDVAGIQYVPGPADDVHDHDMAVVPDADNDAANGIQPPCAGPPDALPSQPGGVRHLMQVVPNLEDQPEQRRIQLWLAADAPARASGDAPGLGTTSADGGELAAFWYVYNPAGSTVGGVASTLVPATDCAAYGEAAGPVGSMFEATVHTGQIAPAAVSDPALGLIARCQQGTKRIYHGELQLSKDQPCGEYGITAVAVTEDGATATLTASFDVLCTIGLRFDFNAVDWGDLTPGQPKVVSGDTVFASPTDGAPTVKNAGNDGMGLKLKFTTLQSGPSGPAIDEFHSCFGRSASTLQCIDPIAAGALVSFDDDPARTLCANETGRLDLAAHPPGNVPADVYGGAVELIGYHIPDRCAGDRHLP